MTPEMMRDAPQWAARVSSLPMPFWSVRTVAGSSALRSGRWLLIRRRQSGWLGRGRKIGQMHRFPLLADRQAVSDKYRSTWSSSEHGYGQVRLSDAPGHQ